MSCMYKITIEMQGEPRLEDRKREIFVEIDSVGMESFAGHMARAANTKIQTGETYATRETIFSQASRVMLQTCGGHFLQTITNL